MIKPQLQAVLFDLDGVIVDTAQFHYLAWKRLADREKIEFNEKINERLKGVSRMASLDILLEKAVRDYSSEEKQKMAQQKNEWYVESIQTLTPSDILPGVKSLITKLKKEGVLTAICSASKNTNIIMNRLEILEAFDVIISGVDVEKPKPDPEVFTVAADKLAIPYQNCVVIEDSFAGLQAAKTAGMKGVGVGTEECLTNADKVYPNMQEVTLARLKELYL